MDAITLPVTESKPHDGRVLGDFVVEEKLGEGGFGAVHRARQRTLGREAVVKILRPRHHHAIGAQRFLREAQLAALIDHPYAAHVYAFGAEPDGLLWIAMELVRGTPLDAMIRTQGALPFERFLVLFERLCEVVQAAHEQGIVHRDIKPSNVIVVSRAGRLFPKLIDLGIATRSLGALARPEEAAEDTLPGLEAVPDGLTNPGELLGSPLYMAPEQWRDAAQVDRRADIYALGALAFECLMGRPPFSGTSLLELSRAHQHEVPPTPLPLAVGAVVLQALAKRPEDRPATALELAAALRRAAGIPSAPVEVPRLPVMVVDRVLAGAPRPIADAVAAIDGATTLRHLRIALVHAARAIVRYVGVVSLAARARLAAEAASLDDARSLLLELRRRRLEDDEWFQLARALCRPFAELRDAFPVPELVDFMLGVSPGRIELGLMLAALAPTTPDDAGERRVLAGVVRDLAATLEGLRFLDGYPIATPSTRWMGIAHGVRTEVVDGDAAIRLLGSDGIAVLDFGPLIRIATPLPAAASDLFVFDGRARRGGVLCTTSGFELADDAAWSWLGSRLLAIDDVTPAGPVELEPYRGLASFSVEDGEWFFGRDHELATFRNRLRVEPLLAIVGASGVGKSSFVRAGVVADASREWRAIMLRPGARPLAALGAALIAAGAPSQLVDELPRDPAAVGRWLREQSNLDTRGVAGSDARGTLVVVDQLEELFTLCEDLGERQAFAAVLLGCARTASEPVRVIVTLRDDFVVRVDELGAVGECVARGLFLLRTPSAPDLVRTLSGPCRRVGYEFDEPDLPGRMVAEVADRPAALALLAFAASKLWDLRDRHFHQLRSSAFRSMGGVAGALARHAEATLSSLGADDRKRVRAVFRHLTTADGTRAIVSRADLIVAAGGGAAGGRIVEALLANRLVSTSDAADGEQHLEIVHEALLGAWPRLAEWTREDREGTRLRDQLREAARQWLERGEPHGLLWRDDALAELERWQRIHADQLGQLEARFAGASRAAARRTRRRRRGALGAAVVTIAIVLVAGFWLTAGRARERDRAEHHAEHARARRADAVFENGRRAVLAGDAQTGLLYLARAIELGRDDRATRVLIGRALLPLRAQRRLLAGHTDKVWSVAVSPDRKSIATTSSDRTVRLWSSEGSALHVLRGHTNLVYSVSFSPDGTRLLSASVDGTARVWNAHTGQPVAVLECGSAVASAGFSPDGTRVLTGSHAGGNRLWDAATGKLVHDLGQRPTPFTAMPFAFSRDGRVLVASDAANEIHVFDVASGRRVAMLDTGSAVRALAAVGDDVIAAGADHAVRIWSLEDRRLRATLSGHRDRVDQLAVSSDGSRLVTGSADGTARVWELPSGRSLAILPGHAGRVHAVAISADHAQVVTSAADGARVFAAETGTLLARFDGHGDKVWSAGFVDNHRVVTASWDRTVRIWDSTPQELITWLDLGTPVGPDGPCPAPLAFSPDGNTLVIGGARGAAVVDAVTGRVIVRIRQERSITGAAWSPRGDRIVLGDTTGTVVVVEPGGRIVAESRAFDRSVVRIAFAPHANTLLAAAENGPVRILSTADLRVLHTVIPQAGMPPLAAWSDDGALVAAARADGGFELWSAQRGSLGRIGGSAPISALSFTTRGALVVSDFDGALHVLHTPGSVQPRTDLRGHTNGVFAVSSLSSTLVTGSIDGTVRQWSGEGAVLRTLRHSAAVMDVAVDRGETVAATAADNGNIRLWDLAHGRELAVFPVADRAQEVAFAANDRRLVAAGFDGLRVWRVEPDLRLHAAIVAELRCRVALELNEHDEPVSTPVTDCLTPENAP